jgi:pyridoxamine 5'-phosphate oxidase family protein
MAAWLPSPRKNARTSTDSTSPASPPPTQPAPPHVVPVGFRLSEDGEAIEIGGHDVTRSKKWRDLAANPKAAVVVDDDLERVDPWTPRGIEVRGVAELHESGGDEQFGPDVRGRAWIRIVPERVTTWGIGGHAFSPAGRRRSRTVGG